MDFQKLFQAAKLIGDRLETAKTEARNVVAHGESGGGMVKAVMNGEHRLIELKIDNSVLGQNISSDDLKLLENLIQAACNQATETVVERIKERFEKLSKDAELDPKTMEAFASQYR